MKSNSIIEQSNIFINELPKIVEMHPNNSSKRTIEEMSPAFPSDRLSRKANFRYNFLELKDKKKLK